MQDPPLSAPQPTELREFFPLIRPPFKQTKQNQYLEQPGRLIGDLCASCYPSVPGANSSGPSIIS